MAITTTVQSNHGLRGSDALKGSITPLIVRYGDVLGPLEEPVQQRGDVTRHLVSYLLSIDKILCFCLEDIWKIIRCVLDFHMHFSPFEIMQTNNRK